MTTDTYDTIDEQLLSDAAESDALSDNLFHLCDRIGPRFAGTPGYRQAAEFMRDRFERYGLHSAHLEPFELLAWRRGDGAQLAMTAPFDEPIGCYALPYSASTPPDGITAEVIEVGDASAETIAGLGEKLAGKLALVNRPGRHRMELYDDLAAAGAAGMLFSSRFPGMGLSTGSVGEGAEGAIPAVSIGMESGLKLERLAATQPVTCRLVGRHRFENDTTWNVIAELPGSEHPDELVLVGGHLDSHEIGPGAYDNGAGAMMVLEMARLLAGQREHLKRTVRFIGFAGEEVGLLGSQFHAEAHTDEWPAARVMINCDMPALCEPWKIGCHSFPQGAAYTARLSEAMGIDIEHAEVTHCHSDHYPFTLRGLPTIALVGSRPATGGPGFCHMAGDTPDKVPMDMLGDAAAFMARVILRTANDDNWPAG